MFKLFKKKKTLKLTDLLASVGEIAASKGRTYYYAQSTATRNSSGKITWSFWLYIDGYEIASDPSPSKALSLLKEKIEAPIEKRVCVDVDLPF